MNILEIKELSKSYASAKALDGVSLSVRSGAICGLLGPNGAGKTTMLRVINGLLTFDSGSVSVSGKPVSLKTARNIGYMPEERGLYDKMRVEDQIMYLGRLKGGDPRRLREVMNEYLDLFNLNGQHRRRIKELSKGNQQKVQIIATIVHEPELVIFDEPFSGFDPINGALLEELIARLHKKGATIMLSSHNMPAVEEICDDIALISHGRILLDGAISDIKENHKTDILLLTSSSELKLQPLMESGLFLNIESTDPIRGRKGFPYRIRKNTGVRNNDLLDAVAIQSDVLQFEEALPSLNDIFIRYTSEKETDSL